MFHSVAVLLLSLASLAAAVETDSLRDELARIFGPEKHYEPEAFRPARWLLDGEAYTTLESSESVPDAKDIVRYESGSAKREVLVDAKSLVPPGGTKPLEIKDYAWSEDHARLLVFTNAQRVWRRDTRGDY